jgi:hypothetical protein
MDRLPADHIEQSTYVLFAALQSILPSSLNKICCRRQPSCGASGTNTFS